MIKQITFQKCILVLGLPLLLAGCGYFDFFSSDEDSGNEPAELIDFVSEVEIKKLWSVGVGDGQGDAYNRLEPVMNDGLIIAAGTDGVVLAVDQRKGKKQWRTDLELPISGGVGADEGMALLGTSGGVVVALDSSNGNELWRATVTGEVLAPPQTDGVVVAVQTFDGKIFGLNASDGSQLWRYDSTLPVLTLRGTASPVFYGGVIYAGLANGKVVALDRDSGTVSWERRLAIPKGDSEIERIVDIEGAPYISGDVLYAVSYQGGVGAVRLPSGQVLWLEDESSYVGVGEGFGNIYVADEKGTVTARSLNNGVVGWQTDELAYRSLSAPRAFRSYVAVGDFEGYVHLLSQVDGHVVGRVKVDSDGVRANMLSRENTLIVYGNGGDLVAYRVSPKN
jgi:outer membrane protein assembly factor BamB